MIKPPRQDTEYNRTQGTAQGPRPNPRNPLGCSYALVPARLLDLPGGELVVLSWLLAARRKTCCLGYTLAELGAATGFCGRTVQAHVASLRAAGRRGPP